MQGRFEFIITSYVQFVYAMAYLLAWSCLLSVSASRIACLYCCVHKWFKCPDNSIVSLRNGFVLIILSAVWSVLSFRLWSIWIDSLIVVS